MDRELLSCTAEGKWRAEVSQMLDQRNDATTPIMGWPWPWDNSRTTDYAYAFDEGKVWAASFGTCWFDPLQPEPELSNIKQWCVFPDMSSIKNVAMDKRSGLLFLRIPKEP